ncbi:MAG: YbaB/EbfC family nucleoid-associated protein [Butyricicoccus sp.]
MAKGKFGGMGGGMNMQAMIKQAQKMQQDMLKAQDEIAAMETEATAGGGAVKAIVQGTSNLKALEIKPEVVDPDDVEMLQDLVLAAVNEAFRLAAEKSEQSMKKVTGGMGGGMPGLF